MLVCLTVQRTYLHVRLTLILDQLQFLDRLLIKRCLNVLSLNLLET